MKRVTITTNGAGYCNVRDGCVVVQNLKGSVCMLLRTGKKEGWASTVLLGLFFTKRVVRLYMFNSQ